MRKSADPSVYKPSVSARIRKSMPYYVLILVPLLYLLLFRYYPMLGVQIAFRKYKAKLGIWGSPWVGLKYFQDFFGSATAGTIILNTFVLSIYYLVASFPFPIILAIALNECRSRRFRKVTQMVTYMPYFISIVVVVAILFDFCKSEGILTMLAKKFGWSPVSLVTHEWLGRYDEGDRTLYVTAGVGALIPFRFGVPGEIVVITLKRK